MLRARAVAALLLLAPLAGCVGEEPPTEIVRAGALGERTVPVNETVRFEVPGAPGEGRYFWDFGDNETAFGPSASHVYDVPGRYLVSVQEIVGGAGGEAWTGVAYVNLPLELEGAASERFGPSEVRIPVEANATRIALDLDGKGVTGTSGRLVLADPTGALAVEQSFTVESSGRLQAVLETRREPEAGAWLLVVEASEGRLEWEATGLVDYAPR